MKNTVENKFLTAILILTLVVTTTLTVLPLTTAQEDQVTKNSFPLLSFSPNPVGVNQEVLITYGITDAAAWPQPGWTGLRLTIERPDGEIETFDDLRTDTTGLSGMMYVPDMVGTYYVKLYFPQQEVEVGTLALSEGMILLASETERRALVVQEERRENYPGHDLPEEYWTRPIDSQLREWHTIAGNWLEVHENVPNRYAPYNEYAPETAHILWTKPLAMGGLAGGARGSHAFSDGDAYEGKFQNSIIIGGTLYYNSINTRDVGQLPAESQKVVAVDLHTGEEKWSKPLIGPDGNIHSISFGQVMYWNAFNHHAVYPYLWATTGSTWHAFEPFTGEWSYSIENVPSGERVHGENGEILIYTININEGWMSLWNSTRAVNPQNYGDSRDGSWGRHIGREEEYSDRIYPGERGIEWNVSIPDDLPPLTPFYSTLILEDRIIGTNTGNIFGGPQPDPEFWALSIEPGNEGELLWREEWTLPVDGLWVHFTPNFRPTLEDGVFLVQAKETGQNWGFDIDTGQEIWGPTEPLPDIATATNLYFPRWGQGVGADGIVVLGGGMGGQLRGHNVQTGQELWRYNFTDEYTEILWSENWPTVPQFVADGKVYVAHQEHSPLDPKPRGSPFVVLDLETGEEVFKSKGLFRSTRWGGQHLIGDSIMAAMDTYDQQIYAVGKGPSETTVSAPDTGVPMGSSVTIRGTVMDASPGTEEQAQTLRFPNGVPAIADEDMSAWMGYVYKQMECPDDVNGVPVKLTAVDPNGNTVDIGTTTSDGYGFYSHSWTPEMEGKYTIRATFEGSRSYWPSWDETAISVDQAPEQPQNGNGASDYTLMFVGIIVAVVIAIVIGIVNLYAIRKQR